MSTAPAEEPTGGIAPHGLIRFTQRGEDALDALAADLAARCDGTPEGIAELLDQVLHADMSELASSLTAPADPTEDQPLVLDADLTQTRETPDEAARRRLGRPQDLPPSATRPRHGRSPADPAAVRDRARGGHCAAATPPRRA